ncbi:FAD-dependent 5-carboxymethylaminomethyl-2-thiouridine(34) oxidoreductase MnmC [Phenylobacterium sp.]|uniref:FAD-dependent 5-carboxymethylaminomethyl-2-thiouridine(34) oxidoreductase MnmC n=1 Tax=Phenylobacterium sp. TaxID=1871053 RepID=UPI0012249AFE|nr:FAD-dependent 5-carboxymethylaminomethyl-2-thiouridine(34) oxidoreductase MnmC [Phenylobacterium sp.]THD62030.1 MAG: FAD-dependent oxidoreductase [Phenylobacterium sp.]
MPSAASESPLDWTADGQPRSRLYDDVYFSAEDGLAEARAVFLAGCGLPDAWAGRSRFTVGELGFGTGLNILALIELWSRARPPGAQLHIFSIEAHPIAADEARRALARWPELGGLAERLLAQWPGRARGGHRVEFPDLGVILDVAAADAAQALRDWLGQADAWFLDGFAPARNPAMWSDEVLGLVGARSAPGAVAATFTVAGQVRRGLAAAGFEVEKAPGFGRKRERLAARRPGAAPAAKRPRRVAIVGAGIAGASAARAVRALGGEALVFDAEGRGAGASGNPAALVTPRLDAGLGPPAQLFAQAFRRAVALYEAEPGLIIASGALQVATQDRDPGRFAKVAASGLFEPGTLKALTPAETSERLGEAEPQALSLDDGLVIEPRVLLAAWTPEVTAGAVARVERDGAGWRLLDAAGAVLATADAVILAAGLATAELAPGLPLHPVRGQASFTPLADPPPAAAFGGYAIPTRGGVLFGATHDRGDTARDVRAEDHTRNLGFLADGLPRLAGRLADAPLEGRASIRVATPDHLPVAGSAPGAAAGLYVLSGLGARGFTLAPLLAEHLAAEIMGAPSPLPRPLSEAVDPARFARRAARRGS